MNKVYPHNGMLSAPKGDSPEPTWGLPRSGSAEKPQMTAEESMDLDVEGSKNYLIRYFLEQGHDPGCVYRMIQHMARSLFFMPEATPIDVKERLRQSISAEFELKEDVFQQLKACLIHEGRNGLEFRLGEGFKKVLEDN
jgi:hypothetical protein